MIFAWWGINGRVPVWHLPADEPDQAGWCDLAIRTIRLPGHPQETIENSVDLAHLRYVHGYGNVDRVDPLLVDGTYLRNRFDFTRTRNIAGIASLTFAPSANTHICGLGYSYVEIHERSIHAAWICDFGYWRPRSTVKKSICRWPRRCARSASPKRWILGLGFLPVGLRAPIMNKFMASPQEHDALQDVEIWGRKQYLSQPRLGRSDGEVRAFRAYCDQFYPESSGCDADS